MKIILGSQSPRRRELMAGLDIPFQAISIDADESYPTHLTAGDIPLHISLKKAMAYADKLNNDELLITSDTVVWVDNQMLGKPHNEEEAKRMLQMLSGKTHQVYTAVTFLTKDSINTPYQFVDKTDVTFRELSNNEIEHYIRQYHPLDKAGAYGIQEWIGYIGVSNINGSYFNVMGFPISHVYSYLQSLQTHFE